MEQNKNDNRSWFRVHIVNGEIAKLIVKASDEDAAYLKVEQYCEENPWLGIVPFDEPLAAHLAAKPLDPIEEDYYNTVGEWNGTVKLQEVRYHQPLEVQKPVQRSIGQLALQFPLF